jgi:hypothetical protein
VDVPRLHPEVNKADSMSAESRVTRSSGQPHALV